jgi:ABC-type polar amino acid transport system ATPase subunit
MSISRMEIKDFLVFNGKFSVDFCPGVNVIIGGNGTGKTTLLKVMYNPFVVARSKMVETQRTMGVGDKFNLINFLNYPEKLSAGLIAVVFDNFTYQITKTAIGEITEFFKDKQAMYIPEKDMLEHARGLLPFIEQKITGFNQIYKDVLIRAQDVQTQIQSDTQYKIGEKISSKIGGHIEWVQSDGSFYTVRPDGSRIAFAYEASGFKKLGFLGLLVTCGQLEPGAILFWDEPENSLNPELIPFLVDILLELSRNGVQIFIATHSEILASYFSVLCDKGDSVMFYSLYKDGEQIKYDSNDRFDLLNPNNLTAEPVRLYEKQLDTGFGNER